MHIHIPNPFHRDHSRNRKTTTTRRRMMSDNAVVDVASQQQQHRDSQKEQQQGKHQVDVVVFKKMNDKDLLRDIRKFLELHSRQSKIFYSCLLYSDLYVNDTPKCFPPACSSTIASLPTICIWKTNIDEASEKNTIKNNNEQQQQNESSCCSICLDELTHGFGLTRMPCGHVFHVTCIVPWLLKSCICPECRYEIPTNDFLYEIGRQQRMRERTIVKCNCHTGRHTCFDITNQQVTTGSSSTVTTSATT